MTPWRRRPPTPPGSEGENPITPEDLAWRIGASEARPEGGPDEVEMPDIVDGHPSPARGDAAPGAAVRGAAMPSASPGAAVQPAGAGSWRQRRDADADRSFSPAQPVSVATRRLVLWRDASALLMVVLIIAVVAQLAMSGDTPGTAVSSESPGIAASTDVAVGPTGTPGIATLPPTVGPVVDPSLIPGIEATPTPVATPRATLRVTPSPQPTVKPATTPPPTGPPTQGPTQPPPTAAPTPSAAPTATPAPPVVASVSCSTPVAGLVTCTSNSVNETPGTEVWTADQSFLLIAGGDGQESITMEFTPGVGAVTITLGVTGPGGGSSDSTVVSV